MDPLDWLERAERDIDHAELSFEHKDDEWGLLACQQSAEKALKAVCLKKGIGIMKVHDLMLLGRKVDAPNDVLVCCGLLNPFYTSSRYPDTPFTIDESTIADALQSARVVVTWCKKQI